MCMLWSSGRLADVARGSLRRYGDMSPLHYGHENKNFTEASDKCWTILVDQCDLKVLPNISKIISLDLHKSYIYYNQCIVS